MKLWHLLAALCIAALAALAIIPALTILRAPMPSLDAITTTTTVAPHYTPWCVDHVSVQPSHAGTTYPSGPSTWWGYDGTTNASGMPTIVDVVTAGSSSAALSQVLADCTESGV